MLRRLSLAFLAGTPLLAQQRTPPTPKTAAKPDQKKEDELLAEKIRLEVRTRLDQLRQDLETRIAQQVRSQLRQDLKQDLKSELRQEIKQELKTELRYELKNEIKQELRFELRQ